MALYNFSGEDDGPYAPKELPDDPLGGYAPHALLAKAFAVKRPGRPEAESQLLETALQERQDAGLYAPLVRQRLADIADTSDETRQARGVANADVMQRTRGGTPFDRAMTRGKALSRVALQGQLQVEQQSLRDRIGMSRFGQGLRSGTNRDLSGLSQLQGENNATRMRSDQNRSAMIGNTLGTIAGAGAAYWQNRNSGFGGGDTALRTQNVNGQAGQV